MLLRDSKHVTFKYPPVGTFTDKLQHTYNNTINSRPININNLDTGMKLCVYTWFPYHSSDRCTEVNDITILDSWVISAQGHFTKKTDLFPRKVIKSFNGCPMQAFETDGHLEITTQN